MTGGELFFHLNRIGFNAKGEAIQIPTIQPVEQDNTKATIATDNKQTKAELPAADIDIPTTATTKVEEPIKRQSRQHVPALLRGGFEEDIVKFWAAGLVLAIGHLHSSVNKYKCVCIHPIHLFQQLLVVVVDVYKLSVLIFVVVVVVF
jgi:hypothetical protein